MSDVQPGEILLGKYRVEEVIGVGGMGRVVRASHLYLQQPVAIKLLLPQMTDSESTVARFLREAQQTVRLRSEHIARVMDVGTMPDGTPFMVMEYLEGHDLNQILRHHGPQLPGAVVDLILQACEGIAEAHALGIVHRDIKPSNFYVTHRPDGSNLLKILDFGISKVQAEVSDLTGTQTVVGTPTYMAPEQMVSARSTDPRSDIWSIGVVMYQMLAGRPPFDSETYAQLVINVTTQPPAPFHVQLPPGLGDIVFRCLEKDPKLRMQNVGELARMLAPYASDPYSAQQIAERAARILSNPNPGRASNPGIALSGGTYGGLNMTPPALTPISWTGSNPSSLSRGAGQLAGTQITRGGRGLLIGGVATLCILAGVGGFLIAGRMNKSAAASTSPIPAAATAPAAASPAPSPVAATPTVKPTTPVTPTVTPTPVTPTVTPTVAKTTETSSTSAATPAKSTPVKSTKTTTTATKSTATKTSATKTTATKTTKTTKTNKSGGDLFDDRR